MEDNTENKEGFSYDESAEAYFKDVNLKRRPSPYGVTISNKTDKALYSSIFGFSKNIHRKNYGSDDGIDVTTICNNVSYTELLCQSAFEPFETELICIKASDIEQLKNVLNIESKDASGQSCTIPLIIESYLKDIDENGWLEIPYKIIVNHSVNFTIKVLPNTELEIRFYPKIKKL